MYSCSNRWYSVLCRRDHGQDRRMGGRERTKISKWCTIWNFSQAAISLRPKDMENLISKFHSITEAANKTWDYLHGNHEWIQQSSMELQESNILMFLNYDIEVPCIMLWEQLWSSSPSHSNEILIKGGVFRTCHGKLMKNAIEASFTCSLEKGTRQGLLSWQHIN